MRSDLSVSDFESWNLEVTLSVGESLLFLCDSRQKREKESQEVVTSRERTRVTLLELFYLFSGPFALCAQTNTLPR